jgi:ABC-type multidrug transport system permease subunit
VWKIVAICYNIPQYFLTGFQRSADKFFTWFCIVYVLHMTLSMVFRAIAVASPNIGRAVLPVGLMFNVFVLYTGLYVPGPQMQVWLFWIKYLNVSILSPPGPLHVTRTCERSFAALLVLTVSCPSAALLRIRIIYG